jgi:electron transfer flavoprotein beta subunit
MKLVCIAKLVPDPRSTIKPLPDGSGVDRAGLKSVCDPFDEFGLELAVQIKEKRTDVAPITVVTAGPPGAAEALRHALAMGCERAVHIVDDSIPAWDELFLAQVLSAAIRTVEPQADLIICGKQAIDNDAGELGPAIAEHLGLPHVGAIVKFDLATDGRSAKCYRRVEGAEEVVEVTLPAVVTIEKGCVEPRRPALAKLMKAKQIPIQTITPAKASGKRGSILIKLSLPPSRPACVMIGGAPDEMARELVRRLREEAKVV